MKAIGRGSALSGLSVDDLVEALNSDVPPAALERMPFPDIVVARPAYADLSITELVDIVQSKK